MTYKVELAPTAAEVYAAADRPLARKLARCFTQLESEPRHHNNIKPLRGRFAGMYRFRVGDYRVIYHIDDPTRRVNVLMIAHRRDVYD